MVQLDGLPTFGNNPRVPGGHGTAVEHHDLGGTQGHQDFPANKLCRDGVLHHPHGDHRGPVHPGCQHQPRVEGLCGQRCQEGLLGGEVLADGADSVVDPPVIVQGFPFTDAVVEIIQRPSSRHGREPVTPEPAHLALDSAFLVRSVYPGLAVEGVEAVVRAKQHPPVILQTLPALPGHHRGDSAGEVVIPDVFGRDAAQDLKGFDVAFQESFLGLRRVNPVDGFAGVGQPEDEHVALRFHPVEHDPDFTEIHLRLRTRRMFLRDEHLDPAAGINIDLSPTDPHIVTHRRV